MSEPTPREALRDKIAKLIADDYACTRVWDAWQVNTMTQDDFEPLNETERVDEIEQLINAEVLAVLDRLEEQAIPVKSFYGFDKTIELDAVGTGHITQLKQRYGGKEQRNE